MYYFHSTVSLINSDVCILKLLNDLMKSYKMLNFISRCPLTVLVSYKSNKAKEEKEREKRRKENVNSFSEHKF